MQLGESRVVSDIGHWRNIQFINYTQIFSSGYTKILNIVSKRIQVSSFDLDQWQTWMLQRYEFNKENISALKFLHLYRIKTLKEKFQHLFQCDEMIPNSAFKQWRQLIWARGIRAHPIKYQPSSVCTRAQNVSKAIVSWFESDDSDIGNDNERELRVNDYNSDSEQSACEDDLSEVNGHEKAFYGKQRCYK
ncbi:hypothetical protein ANN_24819 [Periplaneta americana]|uniref:Uncharacterized protein n=1 Tax=Periplaneta americana TaxID=6978 RepID=A0ABQ8RZW7_PERAM|nr:hypothetical protein ANN_24819 [Periplaneta americana]